MSSSCLGGSGAPMDIEASFEPPSARRVSGRERRLSGKMAEAVGPTFRTLAASFVSTSDPAGSKMTDDSSISLLSRAFRVKGVRNFGDISGYRELSSLPESNVYEVDGRFRAEFERKWAIHLPDMLKHQAKEMIRFPHLAPKLEQTSLLLRTLKSGGIPHLFDRLEIKPSPGKGFGVFVKGSKDQIVIPEDTIVGIYSGIIRKIPDTKDRRAIVGENGYLFQLQLFGSEDWFVDGKPCGSIARFFNHVPFNSKGHTVQPIMFITSDGPVIAFYATEDIRGGAELCYSYGKGYVWQEAPK